MTRLNAEIEFINDKVVITCDVAEFKKLLGLDQKTDCLSKMIEKFVEEHPEFIVKRRQRYVGLWLNNKCVVYYYSIRGKTMSISVLNKVIDPYLDMINQTPTEDERFFGTKRFIFTELEALDKFLYGVLNDAIASMSF